MEQRHPQALQSAFVKFEEALAYDPEFALAWAGVSEALALLYSYRYDTNPATLERSRESALRAIELDGNLAEAWVALALVKYIERDAPAAIDSIQRAIALRPNYAQAYSYAAYFHTLLDDTKTALENSRRAVALDPFNAEAIGNNAMYHMGAGDLDAALLEAERMQELAPDWNHSRMILGEVYLALGRHEEAAEALEGVSVPWTGLGAEVQLLMALMAAGEKIRARTLADSIAAGEDPYAHALALAATGRLEEGWAILETIELWEDWPTVAIRTLHHSIWNPLGNDPRFPAIIETAKRSWGYTGS